MTQIFLSLANTCYRENLFQLKGMQLSSKCDMSPGALAVQYSLSQFKTCGIEFTSLWWATVGKKISKNIKPTLVSGYYLKTASKWRWRWWRWCFEMERHISETVSGSDITQNYVLCFRYVKCARNRDIQKGRGEVVLLTTDSIFCYPAKFSLYLS